jgi:hypothetical protein
MLILLTINHYLNQEQLNQQPLDFAMVFTTFLCINSLRRVYNFDTYVFLNYSYINLIHLTATELLNVLCFMFYVFTQVKLAHIMRCKTTFELTKSE